MIPGPDGVMVRPPVISEAKETWESFDEGKSLRVADTVYEIITQAQFTSVPPKWQEYLITVFNEPELPFTTLQPTSAEEEDAWKKWQMEGWNHGKEQAYAIFESNLNRLNRDFQGMVRYKILVEEGQVTPAVIAQGQLGNTGDGQNMRVNDRAIRITQDPELELDSSKWTASPTFIEPDGTIRGIIESESLNSPPTITKIDITVSNHKFFRGNTMDFYEEINWSLNTKFYSLIRTLEISRI